MSFNLSEMTAQLDQGFAVLVDVLAAGLFVTVPIVQLPLVLFVLVLGGLFFTFSYGFINVRLFRHAFDVILGKYDNPKDVGQISHFQALTSALSATVGLGNIAGVAIAIQLGGPGAVFWLWMVAFFGMSMKFSSCTFAQIYRRVTPGGRIVGGPMVYLEEGFKQRFGLPRVGKIVGVLYASVIVFAALGAGNLFQVNQTYELLTSQVPFFAGYPLLFGGIMAVLVGSVVIGGISRIGEVTCRLVPTMVGFYVVSCLLIIGLNIEQVPHLFGEIFRQAFSPDAAFAGGFIGVMIQGLKRGAFSNEAGIGTAAIIHAAAKTDEPVREGVVAMIGPFIDTHLICTMTALAVLVTGAHLDPAFAGKGVEITAQTFGSLGAFAPIVLLVAVFTFAYSSIISYSYYGVRAVEYLFGKRFNRVWQIVFVAVIFLGPLLSLKNIIDFTDLSFLALAFPNIIGMALLSKQIREMTKDYVTRLKAGKMKTYK
ncbi:MAG: alanine/glycine:cation symporter family protein [Alphaproteobacteria bacterium]